MPKLKISNATFWVIFKHCENESHFKVLFGLIFGGKIQFKKNRNLGAKIQIRIFNQY